MSEILKSGDQAVVIGGRGSNAVRTQPKVSAKKVGTKNDGAIPEHAVLAILPRPSGWTSDYPVNDGVHVWWYVRGRTDKQADGRFEVIEGWTAANEHADSFLMRMETAIACRDTMGTALDTHLQAGQEAYVLPPDGLNVRSEADPHATRLGGLLQGTVVTVTGNPECETKMVWWQAQRIGTARPAGWVSEGNSLEWFLAPLTLE